MLAASASPMDESGMSVHPVNVSREPGALPFQRESPCRVRISVWTGPVGVGVDKLVTSLNGDRIVTRTTVVMTLFIARKYPFVIAFAPIITHYTWPSLWRLSCDALF